MTLLPDTDRDVSVRLIVGMEIHVELACRSKMFTDAPNVAHPDYDDAAPNTLCNPMVIGMPGTLPVINRQAVEMSMLVGLALGCEIASFTRWDRKSYYYPDLPKNYQISQYDHPLCGPGALEIFVGDAAAPKTVRITRAHLEEDAGKLLHEAPGGGAIDYSIVDLNRSGTPLLEIVTEPDLHSPEEAVAFAQALRNICRWLGVSQGIMQKGHMRFEPNINLEITHQGQVYKTPIVEIKNLNSFKAVEGSIRHEFHRQYAQWEATGEVMKSGSKSTRGWNDATGQTFLQREKEEAHDYRYFPDPDLVPLVVDKPWLDAVRKSLPELPQARLTRYIDALALNPSDARTLVDEPSLGRYFEKLIAQDIEPKKAAAILLNNLARLANARGVSLSELDITPAQVFAIQAMAGENKINSNTADDLYRLCCEDPAADPQTLAESKGLLQVSDDASLDAWIDQAIAGNAKSVEAVKAGKQAAIGALVGAVMKLSQGKANPKLVSDRLREKLLG
jgi:aspartyl-tRNA(Asn)/glutamyl-tRNA(Gln) amidotransferase subunit B